MIGWARRSIPLTLFAWLLAATAAADDARLIDDFNGQVQNRLGGYRSPFALQPSTASAIHVADVFHGARGRSIRIQANRARGGYCGYWIHFFDMRAKERRFFDAAKYAYLSFWVRGEKGGEAFVIKLADQTWIAKEDAVEAAGTSQLLPLGITTDWQEVIVPLDRRLPLDWRRLGGITFEFTRPGKQVVYIDDLAFKPQLTAPTPGSQPLDRSGGIARHKPRRKMWVWSTAALLDDDGKRRELFAFCGRQEIDQLWVQLLYDVHDREQPQRTRCTIRHTEAMRTFLREAHKAHVQVHALDGYPEFALRRHHHIPLAVVDAVIAFNRHGAVNERFAGIHFDNEPYLLIGWQDPNRRETILQEFLELNAECQRRVRERSGMQFGVDIPFWWQERDERTGNIVGDVEFRGRRQAASFHCIDLLDNVGVMNYRDTADGADGMIAHGRDLLEYADTVQRATVYMGVETFLQPPTRVWFVYGRSHRQFAAAISHEAQELSGLSRLNGFRLRTLDDGRRIHVGIELTPKANSLDELARSTMLKLARAFGEPENAAGDDQHLRTLRSVIERDPSWGRLRAEPIGDASGRRQYFGFTVDSIMLPKISFADDSLLQLETQVNRAEEFFSRYDRYGGTAVHAYRMFAALAGE